LLLERIDTLQLWIYCHIQHHQLYGSSIILLQENVHRFVTAQMSAKAGHLARKDTTVQNKITASSTPLRAAKWRMKMFGMLENLVKATVGVVVQTPIALIADVITLGGAIVDKDEPYTATALKNVMKNVGDAVKPD
jgi:hypothetical protein